MRVSLPSACRFDWQFPNHSNRTPQTRQQKFRSLAQRDSFPETDYGTRSTPGSNSLQLIVIRLALPPTAAVLIEVETSSISQSST